MNALIRSLLRRAWRSSLPLLLAAFAGTSLAAPKPIAVWTRATFSTEEATVIKQATAAFNRMQQTYKVDLFASHYQRIGSRVWR